MTRKNDMTQEENNPLIPKLRFPEFRNAGGWRTVQLSEVLDYERPDRYIVNDTNYVNDGIPVLTANKSFVIGYTRETKNVYTDVPVVIFDDFTTDKKLVTFAFKVKSSAIKILKAKKGDDLRLLYELMAQIKFDAQEHKRYYISEYQYIKIPLPEINEQKKIAEFLSTLDELIEAESRKLDALKDHKKGLMQQLFPREGETRPRLRFPEFRNAPDWEVSQLSKLILSLDAGVSVNGGDRPASGSELGVLKTSAVTGGFFEPNENKVVVDPSEQARLAEPVRADTIIISRMNTPALVGANAYINKSFSNLFLPDRLWAAKPRKNVSMRFLSFVLGSDRGRAALAALATGTSGSMKNISKQDVLNLPVMLPSLSEQHRIASCLASLDDLIAAQRFRLEALRTHKRGLMQQLFPNPSEFES